MSIPGNSVNWGALQGKDREERCALGSEFLELWKKISEPLNCQCQVYINT